MKYAIKTSLIIVVLISVGLLGCTDDSPEDEKSIEEHFIGQWKDDDFGGQEWIFTFSKDGTYDTNRTIPGTWTVINNTHLDLALNDDAVTYTYSFSDSYSILTLQSTGFGDMNWRYDLKKIE